MWLQPNFFTSTISAVFVNIVWVSAVLSIQILLYLLFLYSGDRTSRYNSNK